eukprot:TRINITY_DN13097_c0_g1_i1.p1 TRINITY_DN13097_c0_g1~~TRINITY_DN13097_c0_g1_i1.p1  ORF type:complete len:634 (+),score=276.85 TRINITY_DN13097_c0_g1_i1:60-1961(+)
MNNLNEDDSSKRRIEMTLSHIEPNENNDSKIEKSECAVKPNQNNKVYIPPHEDELKWNGWGYKDTAFILNDDGVIELTGNKYWLSGSVFPKFLPFIENQMEGADTEQRVDPQESMETSDPIINEEFLEAIKGHYNRIELDRMQCVRHAHGHTAQEIYILQFGKFERVPDVVVWPGNHEQVQYIIDQANKYNVVIIPFGGGTSVTQAVLCPTNEKRMIVSLDMKMMNHIKWVDRESLLACVEGGMIGKELEARLGMMGLCFGHEPDSHEFSTLGGWVATRASGMKKNTFGNIEDLVIHIKMATSIGTVEKNCAVPRISTGPDIHEMMLGSEGIFGVVTEVTIKLQPIPAHRSYGAIAFKDFESGVAFMREIALKRLQPSSIRLMDNQQFQLGQCLAPEDNTKWGIFKEHAKNFYLTQWAQFDLDEMCACTLLFEGPKSVVAEQERQVYTIALKHGGIKAGENSGMKGYFLTYMIAYLRDYGFPYYLVGESFETSVPWANVLTLCKRVKERTIQAGIDRDLPYAVECSYRVTQLYDTGACIYFYFGFIFRGVEDPIRMFNEIEEEARNEILACGGSLSHHHGVGKLRKAWMKETVSPVGIKMLQGLKKTIDPNNIFAAGNLIDVEDDNNSNNHNN